MTGIVFLYVLDHSSKNMPLIILEALIMFSIFPLLKRNMLALAKQIYLWSILLILSYVFWDKGGFLSSPIMIIYPTILMISALIASSITFFTVYFFIISLIVFISTNSIQSHTNVITTEFGYWELCVVILFISASAYIAWSFNRGMAYTLKKLKLEMSNVEQSRNEVERLIHFDPLTKLSSRLDANKKFEVLKAELNEESEQIASLFIDIDNFKSINDYYNHSAGDEVLKSMGSRLLELAQENDVACRLSGDEFLLIIVRPKNYDIHEYTQQLLKSISKPWAVSGNNIEITVSVGVSFYDHSLDESFDDILKRADVAMYRAKHTGKNNYSFYDEALYLELSRKVRMVAGVKTALKNDDLELFLQPKVDLITGQIKSVEALIRWVRNNPEGFCPDEFIPLVESTNLICELGEWVIKKACTLCKELHGHGYPDLSIAVNVSSAQFVKSNLEKIIIRELQSSQLDPKYLELEITEHTLFQDDKGVIDELSRIKDLGVRLSIDDFGTGYSNLSYLIKFQMDALKIDRSFVANINESSDSFAIVDGIIKMARALDLNIVAEGVETKQEWDVLKKLGCDLGQGYIWAKPLPSDEFLKHISEAA
jgi:diguanylate cyclase (GGDEF)-like protein